MHDHYTFLFRIIISRIKSRVHQGKTKGCQKELGRSSGKNEGKGFVLSGEGEKEEKEK